MKLLNPPNFLDLSDTTALITGGAGMLGRQYTAALLKCGSNVIILDNKSSKKNLVNLLKKESKLVSSISILELNKKNETSGSTLEQLNTNHSKDPENIDIIIEIIKSYFSKM